MSRATGLPPSVLVARKGRYARNYEYLTHRPDPLTVGKRGLFVHSSQDDERGYKVDAVRLNLSRQNPFRNLRITVKQHFHGKEFDFIPQEGQEHIEFFMYFTLIGTVGLDTTSSQDDLLNLAFQIESVEMYDSGGHSIGESDAAGKVDLQQLVRILNVLIQRNVHRLRYFSTDLMQTLGLKLDRFINYLFRTYILHQQTLPRRVLRRIVPASTALFVSNA